jgi:putative DNA methylase
MNPRWFCRRYGLKTYGDLFTPRQLVALTTFSDLVQEARERVKATPSPPACPTTAKPSQSRRWRDGVCGCGGVYLAFALIRRRRLLLVALHLGADPKGIIEYVWHGKRFR